MLQNYATIPLYITHKNVTFCHEGTGVQKGFLVAACLFACSLFKHPLLFVVTTLYNTIAKYIQANLYAKTLIGGTSTEYALIGCCPDGMSTHSGAASSSSHQCALALIATYTIPFQYP